MRRTAIYALLLGVLTGLVAGVAAFGLPLPAEDLGGAPQRIASAILAMGLGLADAVVLAGAAAILVLVLVATVDLRRLAHGRRL